MARSDIQNAFKLIPIRQADHELQGFEWQGSFYYDKTLVMGCSISCRIFEAFSSALQWILTDKFKITSVTHILDDLFFTAHTKIECQAMLDKFLWLCDHLGVPIALEKTLGPDQCLAFVGITIDSIKMETRLPVDKIQKATELLSKYSRKRSIRLHELQSLLGFLAFCCKVILPGRCFLRRLIDLTIGTSNRWHHITLKSQARADMAAWLEFLQGFNGKTMFIEETWISSQVLHLFTDSSSLGYGSVLGSRWLYGDFPTLWKDFNIVFLELVPIVIAVNVWSHLLRNHSILFHTDNNALVACINKQSSRHSSIMSGIRKLVVACLKFNIRFRAVHVPGLNNQLCDALSRFQFQRFRALAPHCSQEPTVVPVHLQPANLFKP